MTPQQLETRGTAWVVGAFLICPCHLPLTLGLAVMVLSGTTAGVVLRDHVYIAGAIISIVWGAATWHGFRLIRSAKSCPIDLPAPAQTTNRISP